MSAHPTPGHLALLASGDLPFYRRWSVRRHLRHCSACQDELAWFQQDRASLQDAVPPALDWFSLSTEMQANIRRGLAAAPPAPLAEPLGLRAAAVFASLAFVALANWYLSPATLPLPATAVLNTSADGLKLQQANRALTLLNPGAQQLTTSVSWDGAARARFVDSETGQVTIHQVYVE